MPGLFSYAAGIPIYCNKEFTTAFNLYLQQDIEKFLPVRIEDISIDALYNTTVYIDLFGMDEAAATKKLLDGVGNTVNPRIKGRFPGNKTRNTERENPDTFAGKPPFPGGTLKSTYLVENTNIRNIIITDTGRGKKREVFNRLICDVFMHLDSVNYIVIFQSQYRV